VGAVELDRLSWPEVQAELAAGRDSVVIAFGATVQHGPHMPLATEVLLGDHLARLVADRIDAFLAPTVRIGCSEHHLAFPRNALDLRVDVSPARRRCRSLAGPRRIPADRAAPDARRKLPPVG
jgi:creatinine amidohydrolase